MNRSAHAFAPAKVNLALHVIGRRSDGYHELDTLAVFCDVGDRIEAKTSDRLTLTVAGPMTAHAPAGERNLVLRAAQLLRDAANVAHGAEIRLEKHLPSGAGFGGGSADAAAALLALNELWACGFDGSELSRLGVQIGADVPMCLHRKAMRATGIGEQIESVDNFSAIPLLLVWPDLSLSTAEIFANLERRGNPALPALRAMDGPADAAAWLASARNDLEAPAIAAAPAIAEVLQILRASRTCILARMSGSGSGCFGIFPTLDHARAAAGDVRAVRPTWWVAATTAC